MLAFFWNFVLNLTVFPCFVAIDHSRQQRGWHSCVCCAKPEDAAKVGSADAAALPDDGSGLDGPGREEPGREEPVDKIINKLVIPVISTPAGMAAVSVVTAIVMITSLILVGQIQLGLDTELVVPDGSYVITYLDEYQTYWSTGTIQTQQIVIEGLDYSDPTALETCCYDESLVSPEGSLFDQLESYDFTIGKVGGPGGIGTWLYANLATMNAYGLDTSANFNTQLDSTIENTPFQNDVICAGKGGDCSLGLGVSKARFQVFTSMAGESVVIGKADATVNDNGNGLDKWLPKGASGYAWNFNFCYSCSNEMMPAETISTMCWAVAAVTLSLLLTLDVRSAFIAALVVASINVNLLGMMVMLGIKLHPPSYVCLVMSVGLSVDYCVHIAHVSQLTPFDGVSTIRPHVLTLLSLMPSCVQGYKHGGGSTPVEKMQGALHMMGGPVLKGSFTTFLGIMALVNSSSAIFRIFFTLLFWTIIFGSLYGLFVTPLLLAACDAVMNKIKPPSDAKISPGAGGDGS